MVIIFHPLKFGTKKIKTLVCTLRCDNSDKAVLISRATKILPAKPANINNVVTVVLKIQIENHRSRLEPQYMLCLCIRLQHLFSLNQKALMTVSSPQL